MISIGDEVEISFVGSDCLLKGRVVAVPTMQGEAWIIESDKSIVYIYQCERVWKKKERS